MTMKTAPWSITRPSALLVLANGTVISGRGLGATGTKTGELCFNTAITGYQEILTDPSYSGQVVTFTFPHIGNIGTNDEDVEDFAPPAGALGAVFRADVSSPSNYRSSDHLDTWLKKRGLPAICGIDTRALTTMIRQDGMLNCVLAHDPDGNFDIDALKAMARDWPGLIGADLAADTTTDENREWTETAWHWGQGFGNRDATDEVFHVVAVDYGAKRNILRLLSGLGARITVVPATATAKEILALRPDGIFLSNGPGDPEATGKYAVPMIRELLENDIPIFGICLGHQLLALALGAQTTKMHQGHHGANHPVKDFTTGKVEIVSMNHGFAVKTGSLPSGVEETHRSLFDGSNCGLRLAGRPVFSVQHHPEASPGPQDSHYLFSRFADLMRERQIGL